MRRKSKGYSRRGARAAGRLRAGGAPPARVAHCPPPCGKMAATTKAEARALRAFVIATNGGRERDGGSQVRFYQCDQTFGVWHWTRQAGRR